MDSSIKVIGPKQGNLTFSIQSWLDHIKQNKIVCFVEYINPETDQFEQSYAGFNLNVQQTQLESIHKGIKLSLPSCGLWWEDKQAISRFTELEQTHIDRNGKKKNFSLSISPFVRICNE